MSKSPTLFKYSLLALTIAHINLSFAEDDVATLSTIQLQANSSENQSSEQSKAYTVKKSSSATKLNIDTQETPQTVNVVTRQQMDDFNLTSTRDILNNTPGVTVTGLETNRTTYTARGFDISNILVDGIGIPQVDSYNYNNSDADSYFYDRIEVVKGADALTNALGDPGATINYIRKRPTKAFQTNAGISYGSWDTQRYEADISGSLTQDGRMRGRLVGYEKTGNSYLDRYSEEKNGFQGILEADLTDSTVASAGYSKTRQYANGSQWGALPLVNSKGEALSYSRSYNYAPSWTYYDWEIDNYFANIEQQLAGDWKLKLGYNLKESEVRDKMLYLSGSPSAKDNTSGIYLYPEIYNQKFKETTANADIQGTFPLFGQRHEANIGYNWSKYTAQSVYSYGSSLGTYTTDQASWSPVEPSWGEFYTAAPEERVMKSVYTATQIGRAHV